MPVENIVISVTYVRSLFVFISYYWFYLWDG